MHDKGFVTTENNLNIPAVCVSGNLIKYLFFRTKNLLKRNYLKFAFYTIIIILAVFHHTAAADHMKLLEQLEQLNPTEQPTPANPDDYVIGDELFGWNIGELLGDYLVQPKLGSLAVYNLKRSPEAPPGNVSVRYY